MANMESKRRARTTRLEHLTYRRGKSRVCANNVWAMAAGVHGGWGGIKSRHFSTWACALAAQK